VSVLLGNGDGTLQVAASFAAGTHPHETFDGNGRTCATCHAGAESFGASPQGIAALFASDPQDPLFIAENDPALATCGSWR
jgi:mono/diheme cytochrome c family protein